jgi:hypothetical protein
MFEAITWGALLRFLQAAAQAAPTLLAGLLVASVFRCLLGPERTIRLFGGRGFRALPQAWALGMLLPVCSLGVIPVIREMRRAGVSGGAILAFALAAPLFNPLSMLYGLTLSAPVHIFSFAACSLVVVTIVGAMWDHWYPEQVLPAPPAPPASHGARRLISMFVAAAREIAGGSLGYVAIALVGVAVLAAVLPPGALQASMNHDNPFAPLMMTAVAIPAYVTPMMAMSQLGSMFQHGNSVGAAFVLLALGAGANVGLLAFMLHNYGLRRSLVWLALITATVLGLAYLVDKPLFPRGATPENHTHVFDVYCRPFHPGQATAKEVWRTLSSGILPYEIIGSLIVAFLLAVGIVLRLGGARWQIEEWLERVPAPRPVAQTWYNRPARAPELAGAVLLGLIALSIVGCFLYYPPVEETFKDMRIARTEAISAAISGEEDLAERWIDICDDWARRLEVGMYLRHGGLNESQVSSGRDFRLELELLEHAVSDADRDTVRKHATKVENAYQALRKAYLGVQLDGGGL